MANKYQFPLNVVRRVLQAGLFTKKNNPVADGAASLSSCGDDLTIHTLSHEIHTAFNGVIGMLDCLRDTALTPTQRAFTAMAQESAENLLHRLHSMLDMCMMDSGQLGLEYVAFDVMQELAGVGESLKIAAHGRGLDVVLHTPDTAIGSVIGNPARVRQLAISMVSHALALATHDVVTLQVHAEELEQAYLIRMEVTTHGAQLSDLQLSDIFTATDLTQLSDGRQFDEQELTLATCKKLALLMGGQIGMNRQPEGAEHQAPAGITTLWFSLRLPIAPGLQLEENILGSVELQPMPVAAHPAAAPVPGYPPQTAGTRILIADDNAINQQVALHLLEKLGYQVALANNGQEAIDMHAVQPYQLILMDCQMPLMDGYQATAAIRARETALRTPIIALTAFTMQGEREQCLAAGMDDFLAKPIRPATMREALERWLPHVATETVVQNDEFDAMKKMFGADFAELSALYMSDSPKRIASLRAAVAEHDAERIATVAHSLSGSCASIGATILATLCRELEMQTRAVQPNVQSDVPPEKLVQQLTAISNEYTRVENRLHALNLP